MAGSSYEDFPDRSLLSEALFFQHHRLLHYMLFSKDDYHLRGKISLPLSGELPYWGGGKGFLTASDLQIPF